MEKLVNNILNNNNSNIFFKKPFVSNLNKLSKDGIIKSDKLYNNKEKNYNYNGIQNKTPTNEKTTFQNSERENKNKKNIIDELFYPETISSISDSVILIQKKSDGTLKISDNDVDSINKELEKKDYKENNNNDNKVNNKDNKENDKNDNEKLKIDDNILKENIVKEDEEDILSENDTFKKNLLKKDNYKHFLNNYNFLIEKQQPKTSHYLSNIQKISLPQINLFPSKQKKLNKSSSLISINLIKNKIEKYVKRKIKSFSKEKDEQNDKINNIKKDINEQREKLNDLTKEIENHQEKIKDLNQENKDLKDKNEIRELKIKTNEILNLEKIQILQKELDNEKKEKNGLLDIIKELKEKINIKKEKIQKLKIQNKKYKDSISNDENYYFNNKNLNINNDIIRGNYNYSLYSNRKNNYSIQNILNELNDSLKEKQEQISLEKKNRFSLEQKIEVLEKELENKNHLIQILKIDNKKYLNIINAYSDYKNKVQLEDLIHKKDEDIEQLNNEIKLYKNQLNEHKKCQNIINELNENIKNLKKNENKKYRNELANIKKTLNKSCHIVFFPNSKK